MKNESIRKEMQYKPFHLHHKNNDCKVKNFPVLFCLLFKLFTLLMHNSCIHLKLTMCPFIQLLNEVLIYIAGLLAVVAKGDIKECGDMIVTCLHVVNYVVSCKVRCVQQNITVETKLSSLCSLYDFFLIANAP